MGIMGELFGRNLEDEGSEDSNGEKHRPRFDLDIDSGTVRLIGARPAEPGDRE